MSEEIKWLKSLDNFKAHLDSLERLHSNFKQEDVWQIPYNPIQNIWNKIQKSSNIGQEEKSLMSIFEWFLLAIAKIEFLEEKLGTRIWDFKSYVGEHSESISECWRYTAYYIWRCSLLPTHQFISQWFAINIIL